MWQALLETIASGGTDTTALDVKRVVERPLLGQTATVPVIGSSPCLSVPALDFHELCSFRPLPISESPRWTRTATHARTAGATVEGPWIGLTVRSATELSRV